MTAVPARFVQATAPARGIILSSPHASPPLFEAGACAKEAKREGERAGPWNPFGSFAKADAGVGGGGVAGSIGARVIRVLPSCYSSCTFVPVRQ